MKSIQQILSGIPAFSGLSQHQLADVGRIAVQRSPAKGETIFSEGDAGNGFYVVADGQVKIFKLSLDGKEQILHIINTGEPFGEVAVFAGRSFPAYAQALCDSRLLFFPRQAFVELISQNPALAMNMLAVLSMRLRQFTVQVENLSLKEVPGRLASYLLLLSREQGNASAGLELPISKGQLASLLGTIPETLSRIFAKMNAIGLIEVQGRTIRILDLEGLEAVSTQGKTDE
jgi:CRP-like cAMP-binding protein